MRTGLRIHAYVYYADCSGLPPVPFRYSAGVIVSVVTADGLLPHLVSPSIPLALLPIGHLVRAKSHAFCQHRLFLAATIVSTSFLVLVILANNPSLHLPTAIPTHTSARIRVHFHGQILH